MKITSFIKKEFYGWGKYERFILPLIILLIISISVYMKDRPTALIHAICGVCATILAGKGKISCYFFGMIANICYAYISFKNAFWGNLILNMLYYFPMQFVGIAKWKNHLKKDTQEIYKTSLSAKERLFYLLIAILFSIFGYIILKQLNDLNPSIDSITTVLSIIAFLLTVKRCIEQWYIWTIVNALSVIMWIIAYLNGSQCFATILMWGTYFALGLYFLKNWDKEII
ncbi:nicotinamide mononucleotide transporter [bacterium]|nr:nicotinamide mononucleotide transporter [bacterium]